MTFAMWDDCARSRAARLRPRRAGRGVHRRDARAAFVSGTDIGEFRAFAGADDGVAYEARIEGVIAALEAIRVPTIAAIGGACTGGGVTRGRLRLAHRRAAARVGVPIARTLGNCISLRNIARVAEIIGLDPVKALLLTGRLIGADEARAAGF